jgi:predicted AlkP superfamily pyrophosphatase or phosphodiesterase
MRKSFAFLLSLILVLPVSPASADAYHAKPKLVVILVIDQFRGDYLERYRDVITTPNGFNLFLQRGAYFSACYYDYANTKTAPGHATIGTGAYTDGHGIGGNEWWDLGRNTDRVITSVEDERYRMVGTFDDLPRLLPPPAPAPNDPRIGASPINLRATTIGDEVRLATQGQAKLFGVSLKDRAAILPAGQTANGAFWIDNATGRFVTSTYYMDKLPEWATKFNKGSRIAQAVKEAGLEDTTQFYSLVGRTPAANSYELDFARVLIEGEQMGQHDVTDVLTVSLSANDIVGHQMGPDSDSQREMVIGLDRDLDSFFTYLDKKVGLANVMIALTADHGVAPIPTEAAKLGIAAARLDLDTLTTELDATLNGRFSPGKGLHYFMPTQELPYLALNADTFGKVPEKEAEQAVVDAMPAAIRKLGAPPMPPNNNDTLEATRKYQEARVDADPSLYFTRSKVDLADGKVPDTEFGRRIAHSYTDHGGWYVMVVPTAYQMEYLNGIQTTHFSPWSYDRHVPLGFFGAEFVPGMYRELVAPVDIAATFASILGVNAPSASVGRILTEALRPATAPAGAH